MLSDICNLPNPANPFNRHLQNRHKSKDPALHISSPRPSEQVRISNRPPATGTVTAQARRCVRVRNRQHQRVETRSDVFGADSPEPCLSAGFFCGNRSHHRWGSEDYGHLKKHTFSHPLSTRTSGWHWRHFFLALIQRPGDGFHDAGEESSVFMAGDFLWRLHRSEQYFTSSQTSFHFRRHWNGRPHTGQILLGRSRGRVIC